MLLYALLFIFAREILQKCGLILPFYLNPAILNIAVKLSNSFDSLAGNCFSGLVVSIPYPCVFFVVGSNRAAL
jgi:hypothetical protein